MELTQTQPLSIVILQDGTRLFAETVKEVLSSEVLKRDYIEIEWSMISTVKWNIRTIRDATDLEYYEHFILEKLPYEVMERMHDAIGKINEQKKTLSLQAIVSHQKRIQDELSHKKGTLTPQEKENRRYNVMRMNDILVKKWVIKQSDADRIIGKILWNSF